MELQLLFTILCMLSVVLFLIVRVTKGGVPGLLTKTFASLCFVLFGLFSFVESNFAVASLFIVAGLIFGLLGDVVLDAKVVYKEHNNIYLNSGMFSFAMGHVCYFVALVLYFNRISSLINSTLLLPILISTGIALVLAPVIYFISKSMGLKFGEFKYQTIAYTFLLVFMSAFSVYLTVLNIGFIPMAVGIVLIFASDLVLSMQYFNNKQDNKLMIVANHVLYYLGQISIASFLFMI